jgi:hypothetical protein
MMKCTGIFHPQLPGHVLALTPLNISSQGRTDPFMAQAQIRESP